MKASRKYILCISYIVWCHMEPMTVNGLKPLIMTPSNPLTSFSIFNGSFHEMYSCWCQTCLWKPSWKHWNLLLVRGCHSFFPFLCAFPAHTAWQWEWTSNCFNMFFALFSSVDRAHAVCHLDTIEHCCTTWLISYTGA